MSDSQLNQVICVLTITNMLILFFSFKNEISFSFVCMPRVLEQSNLVELMAVNQRMGIKCYSSPPRVEDFGENMLGIQSERLQILRKSFTARRLHSCTIWLTFHISNISTWNWYTWTFKIHNPVMVAFERQIAFIGLWHHYEGLCQVAHSSQ
jgi:hypothetical protein